MGGVADRRRIGFLVMLCLWGCHATGPDGRSDSAIEHESVAETGYPTTDLVGDERAVQPLGNLDAEVDASCSRAVTMKDCPAGA